METEVHRDIGRHDAQIEGLQLQVKQLHEDMSDMLHQLQQINQMLSEAKGGWKTLMAAAGLASAATAGAIKFAGWVASIPGVK